MNSQCDDGSGFGQEMWIAGPISNGRMVEGGESRSENNSETLILNSSWNGRFGRRAASGTWRVFTTVVPKGGGATRKCDTGLVRWKVAR